MAEEDVATGGGKGALDMLKTKVGPLPAGVWIAAAVIIFWYLRKKNATTGTAGTATDPAGNTGPIDPKTGYVYGTPQDSSALGGLGGGTGTGSDPGTSGGSTVAGTYADNTAWANAAINYLVGLGEDATAANSAITTFLASQPLNSTQQAMVNLAVQRIGSPPSPPQPGTTPTPIVQPPSPGTVYATNPVTGLSVSPAGTTSLTVKWNRSSNAQGFTVKWGTSASATTGSTTVSGTAGTTTISGLKPGTTYVVQVQATPAKTGAPFASATATTAKAAGGTPAPKPGQHFTEVTVVAWRPSNTPWNSTLSGIADHYHVSGGYQALAKLNGIANPNDIHPGQKIKVPVSA